ncbi:hypothetical protein SSYM_2638, partial [Serratia symbiotica str. Tucson]
MLPLDDLLHHGIGHLRDPRRRHISVIPLFKCNGNLTCGRAFGVQRQDLVIHRGNTGLVFLHHCGLKVEL